MNVDIKDLAIKIGEAGEAFERAYNGQDRLVTITMTSTNAKRLAEYVKQEQNKESCPDCVSRERVNSILSFWRSQYDGIDRAIDDIKQLPSVTPTREHGEWVKISGLWVCSFCHNIAPRANAQKFCDSCGADMRGEQKCHQNL